MASVLQSGQQGPNSCRASYQKEGTHGCKQTPLPLLSSSNENITQVHCLYTRMVQHTTQPLVYISLSTLIQARKRTEHVGIRNKTSPQHGNHTYHLRYLSDTSQVVSRKPFDNCQFLT